MIRLSEAIRLGSMLRPQAFGVFFDGLGTCAQGAALEAIGHHICDGNKHEAMAMAWPWAHCGHSESLHCTSRTHRCPECPTWNRCVSAVVAHLNNDHRWSRERIALYVEQLEQRRIAEPIQQEESCPA